jgi:hypothetical protein
MKCEEDHELWGGKDFEGGGSYGIFNSTILLSPLETLRKNMLNLGQSSPFVRWNWKLDASQIQTKLIKVEDGMVYFLAQFL